MQDSQDYFSRRAEAELKMAQKADGNEAVRAHYLLAGYYLDRVHGAAPGKVVIDQLPSVTAERPPLAQPTAP